MTVIHDGSYKDPAAYTMNFPGSVNSKDGLITIRLYNQSAGIRSTTAYTIGCEVTLQGSDRRFYTSTARREVDGTYRESSRDIPSEEERIRILTDYFFYIMDDPGFHAQLEAARS